MKLLCTYFAILFSFFLSSATIAAETYKFDSDHTYATWHVSHFGFSTVSGKFMATGTLTVDNTKPENSSVDITIDTTVMDTGVAKLNDILKGKNFFDVVEFPTATFKSNKVVTSGKDNGKVTGTLTIRGIAKEVVLNVKLNQQGNHPFYHRDAYGFSATTTIKRSDFGMRGYLPGVSDEVTIDIQAEAIFPAAQ